MAARNSAATKSMERELVIARVFDAPRELVFKAWTDPKHVAQWWGPNGFTSPVCEMDVRPGGALRIVMRGPDGVDHRMIGVFQEVVEPERLAFTNIAVDDHGKTLLEGFTTVTFVEDAGKTKLTLRTSAVGMAAAAAGMLEGMQDGWSQSLERLAEYVGQEELRRKRGLNERSNEAANTAAREISATRVFDASRELVFKAWTDPKQVTKWWGPNGFTNTTYEMDVRPGGVWRFVMHGPNGVDYQNKVVYIEVVEPERLVYAHVSDPQFQVTVTFAEQGGKTRLTSRMLFESAAQRDKVVKEFGAVEGLNQTLDRLGEYVAKAQVIDVLGAYLS